MNAKFSPVIFCGLLAASGVFAAPPTMPPGQSCSTSKQLSASEIQTLLGGHTLCANTSTEKWQEFHEGANGGNLKDYKKGSSDPVDPTTTVGSWGITASGNGVNQDDRLVHSYGGAPYSWKVFSNCDNTSYRLEGNGTYTFTVLQGGPRACP